MLVCMGWFYAVWEYVWIAGEDVELGLKDVSLLGGECQVG